MSSPRDLTPAETEFIPDVLRRLREHFPEWPTPPGREHNLVGFAYYEGCGRSSHCSPILAEAAPFALGQELVERHGFQWTMRLREGTWRYCVTHPWLPRPIDLLSLERGSWNDEEYGPGHEPGPGRRTHDSLGTILKRVREFSGETGG